MKQLLGAKHVFARAIKSPCKSFGKGDGKGKGDRPRQTKKPELTFDWFAKALGLFETEFNYIKCIKTIKIALNSPKTVPSSSSSSQNPATL